MGHSWPVCKRLSGVAERLPDAQSVGKEAVGVTERKCQRELRQMRRAGYCCKLFKKAFRPPGLQGQQYWAGCLADVAKAVRDVSSHENEVIGMRLKPRDSVQNSMPLRPSRRRSGSNRAIRFMRSCFPYGIGSNREPCSQLIAERRGENSAISICEAVAHRRLHNSCTTAPKRGHLAQTMVQIPEPKSLVPNTRRVEPGNC